MEGRSFGRRLRGYMPQRGQVPFPPDSKKVGGRAELLGYRSQSLRVPKTAFRLRIGLITKCEPSFDTPRPSSPTLDRDPRVDLWGAQN
jgi:hypothetical protein